MSLDSLVFSLIPAHESLKVDASLFSLLTVYRVYLVVGQKWGLCADALALVDVSLRCVLTERDG